MGWQNGWRCGLVAAWLLGACSGCGTLTMFSTDKEPTAAVPVNGSVTIHIREYGSEGATMQMPLQGVMHVQNAVDYSNVQRKFRRLFVSLYRVNPQGQWHKMEVRYEVGKKRISPEYDYALQPGDRVVIEEDSSTVFDDMLHTATSPLGSFRR